MTILPNSSIKNSICQFMDSLYEVNVLENRKHFKVIWSRYRMLVETRFELAGFSYISDQRNSDPTTVSWRRDQMKTSQIWNLSTKIMRPKIQNSLRIWKFMTLLSSTFLPWDVIISTDITWGSYQLKTFNFRLYGLNNVMRIALKLKNLVTPTSYKLENINDI